MNETKSPLLRLQELIGLAAGQHYLRRLVLSRPADKAVLRTVVTQKNIGGREMLQAESFLADNKAVHRNFADAVALAEILGEYGQINLLTTVGDCEFKRAKSGRETLLGGDKLFAALSADGGATVAVGGNNRDKNYLLRGDEPFLIELGVSAADGRIHDKKRPKFRQICRFLEQVRDIEPHLPAEGKLVIADLCCGKSYLSFAVYHYFAVLRGREVEMVGVDLKPDVVEFCQTTAKNLGYGGLRFVCGDVSRYDEPIHPQLVISLHACDIATDLVLDRAIGWEAKVILSTPCCHHALNHSLNCEPLSFIARHSMLRQRFCEAATDALRLTRLEAAGYSVGALEFIDPEDTPKNILLRAVRRGGSAADRAAAARAAEEYAAARAFLLGEEAAGK
ncbi:MAG: SAM-dependent methyltransferase [Clostridia bacterium]|nr:SAM-dependent methyltransferase [Clostridia bacterium]